MTTPDDTTPASLAVPASDQAWFWTEEWQTGEAEATAEIAAGGLAVYDDMAALFADMTAFRTHLLAGGIPAGGKSGALRTLAAGAVLDDKPTTPGDVEGRSAR